MRPAPGAKQANRENPDQGVGIVEPQSGIHSVPAQASHREGSFHRQSNFADSTLHGFKPTSRALALWPRDLDVGRSLDLVFSPPLDLELAGLPTLSRGYELGKRLFDLSLAILILPVAAALIAVIAVAIALSSGNPIFFRHRRVGRHGQDFDIWKFRTMRVDGDRHLAEYLEQNPDAREEWRLAHKLRHDPRITRLGRFLRKTSLDELPQIFNIFAGNMSFVGPRPITHAETAKYAERLPCYLAALPGITGLWQVSGRCTLSYEARVALDEKYVRQWSIARDLAILLKTPRAVFCRHGAY
jgi:lipopolysaccharide/colanic/teichoic acid biosynthesis glycosyltransferase